MMRNGGGYAILDTHQSQWKHDFYWNFSSYELATPHSYMQSGPNKFRDFGLYD